MRNIMEQLDIKTSFLSLLLEHDRYTFEHSLRVADLLYRFGVHLGIPQRHAVQLYEIGTYHDIGKLNIPHKILTKREPLTNEEYNLIKQHPIDGYNMLLHRELPKESLECIAYHHENIDGSGYPYGIQGDTLPLYARMLRIVDSFDAMTSIRTYSRAISPEAAVAELNKRKGTWYEPLLVDKFIEMVKHRKSM